MTKQGGMGHQLYVGGVDVGADIQSLSRIGGGPAALDFTPITKSAFERQGGLLDGGMDLTCYFNPTVSPDTTSHAHTVFSALPTADVLLTYGMGTAIGDWAANEVAKQVNYDPNRAQDGSLLFAVQSVANGWGVEWGKHLTAGKRTDTTATNGASLDTLASVAFGWQAYLHVMTVTGTSVTVTLEDSANNSSFTALTGGAFAAATSGGAPSWQRIESASRTATVRQYVRAVTTGTFTSATFVVLFVKNDTLVVH